MKIVVSLLTVLFSAFLHAEVDLVKVDKSERKMYLLRGESIVKEYKISLGANPNGHKEKEGDERTPEGIYTLDYIKEDSSFYKAMHISYPNQLDKENAKKKGINPRWLHYGTWTKKW